MEIDREKFAPEELTRCLEHYDLGRVESMQEFARGSARSPKVVITAAAGKFVFKRRAPGRNDLAKVTFTHQIQQILADRGFPLPGLVPTRKGDTILVLGSNVYEMFHHIAGGSYDGSLKATRSAGRTLASFHSLLADFHSEFHLPTGSYHKAHSIPKAMRTIVSVLPLDRRPPIKAVKGTTRWLTESYRFCGEQAEAAGLHLWPKQIVHGDWHPGNMLFRDQEIAAVVDYDAARLQQRVIDLANGALQFSIIGGGDDTAFWLDEADLPRFGEFMRGYIEVSPISSQELRAVPFLMCEALIAEAVLPIATTGSFGRLEGFGFLSMIRRKVAWILKHLPELRRATKPAAS
ncbi:MAG: phosphotransferase [Phycisphaerae bacterium]|jgi:homoserine kinase type II